MRYAHKTFKQSYKLSKWSISLGATMSEIAILVAMVAAFATYYLYRRSQEPNHLTEICNGLDLKSDLAQVRGEKSRALEYKNMSDAIRAAQRLVQYPNSHADDNITAICSHLANASSGNVLDSLNIFEQNHRHGCHKALLNLAGQLAKTHSR